MFGRRRRVAALTALIVGVAGTTLAVSAASGSAQPAASGSASPAASGSALPPVASRLLAGTVPRLVALARNLGALVPSTRISLTLPLELPHQAAINAYVASEYTPGSRNYRAFLTPAQFGKRFGASVSDVDQAIAALHGLGLSTATPAVNHLYVSATGTVATLERVFGVLLDRFQLAGGETFYSNTADIRLPAALTDLVSGVVGLNSSDAPEPQLTAATGAPRRSTLATPKAVDGGASPCAQAVLGAGYTAPQLAQAYDFKGLYAKGLHGEGMSAALVEFDDYHDSNLATMESCYGITTPVTRRLVDGGTGGPPAEGEAEDMADITTLLEMDPRLAHLYVYEAPTTGLGSLADQGAAEIDLYNAFVTDDLAPVLSSSWGNCEELQSQAYNDLFADVAEEAAVQGQQIFDAAGDSGAVDCRGEAAPTTGSISVEQEAAMPWITGVGGTDLGLESTIAGLGIHDEEPWNDAGAGGGGQSSVWTMPAWQASYLAATHDTPAGEANGCGAPAGQLCRMVPDLALDADPDAGGALDGAPLPPQFFPTDVGSPGYSIYCATPNCSLLSQLVPLPVGVTPPAGAGGWYPIGGTSLATPLAASAAVLWDQEAKRAGLGDVGFLNPLLYRIASNPAKYARDFHDVTTGSNSDQYDTTDCPAGCNPNHLYAAGKGYDMATGLGSIDAANLGADLVAQAGQIDLTPSSETMYGYLKGPRTTQPVSLTSGYRGSTYRAKSSASWLHVTAKGRVPGSLSWYVTPKKLKAGYHHAHVTITGSDGSSATFSVTYSVTRRAKISLSAQSLNFAEHAIDGSGATTTPSCGETVWNDELKDAPTLNGSSDTSPVDASTLQTLAIGNSGPAASELHYAAYFESYTSDWLTADLNPSDDSTDFETGPTQPVVPTTGAVAGGATPAKLKLASVANINAVGGYPLMNQGTYHGVVQIRDLADPSVIDTVPVTLVLGNGQGTPTIAASPTSFSVTLAPGASTTVNLALRDTSGVCGYAYSLQFDQPWASTGGDLYSGTVAARPATAAPQATDTGEGNGFTPITISAAGLAPGTYHANVIVQSQNAAANPTKVPITLTVPGKGGPAPVCLAPRRLSFALHRPRGTRVVLARVYVNGKLTRSYRGRSLRKIAFARPAPRRFKLRIVSKLSDGEQWLITVSYNGCSHSKPKLTHLAHE
jgi:kumamolisin